MSRTVLRRSAPDPDPIRGLLDSEHQDLAERLSDIVVAVGMMESAATDEAARVQARDLLGQLGRAGLYEAIGAQNLRACCLIREALGAAYPLADAVFALQALGTTPLLLAGNGAVFDRWIEPALRGELMAAFAMTELEAGSDVGAMSTSAIRDGDRWLLNGAKTLISNAGIADFYVVFASTDPGQGTRGLSAFFVPADTPGLEFGGAQILSAPHPLGEIRLTDCRIPIGHLIGGEGDGFKVGMATLDQLRPTVGAAACGMATRALEEALQHARTRHQFDRPLSEFQVIQEKLGRMYSELMASRLLVYRAAWAKDNGADRITLEASVAKAYATEAAQRVVDEALQILGGQGALAEHPVDRLYRSIRALRIYEGTTEIQRIIIARHLLKNRDGAEEGA